MEGPFDDVPALVGSVFAENKKLNAVILLVYGHTCQFQYSLKYLMTVAFALFRINIKDTVLARRQVSFVFQYLSSRKRRCDYGAYIEGLFAFRFPRGCTEIA